MAMKGNWMMHGLKKNHIFLTSSNFIALFVHAQIRKPGYKNRQEHIFYWYLYSDLWCIMLKTGASGFEESHKTYIAEST